MVGSLILFALFLKQAKKQTHETCLHLIFISALHSWVIE